MKLYFEGHNERYAVEQSLVSLLPGELPSYPEGAPRGEDTLLLSFTDLGTHLRAAAQLRRAGKSHSAQLEIEAMPEADALVQTRLRRRLLQRCFYRVAVESLGKSPPWGMISGVRPVKLPTRALLNGQSEQQVRESLCQSFDITPTRADLAMDCARAAVRIRRTVQAGDVALYLSIPFCPTRCTYCSFISQRATTQEDIASYLKSLHQEIEAVGAQLRAKALRIRSVYIGGGTPTTLDAYQLEALLAQMHRHLPLQEGVEFTVEAGRPDTITREKLAALRRGGVNRISINPQTLHDPVLAGIGRRHSVADFYAAWEASEAFGFTVRNVDLIAGLPLDTSEGFAQTLDGVLALAPENITIHTLALKRGARLHAQGARLQAELTGEMLDYAEGKLRAAGYLPYYLYRQKYMAGGFENVGWCKEGCASDYNVCMMEELSSVLALGAGAASKRIDYDKGSLARQINHKYPLEYNRDLARLIEDKRVLIEGFTQAP